MHAHMKNTPVMLYSKGDFLKFWNANLKFLIGLVKGRLLDTCGVLILPTGKSPSCSVLVLLEKAYIPLLMIWIKA